MSFVFPVILIIIGGMIFSGIKLGGCKTSKILFWLIFFPLLFVIPEMLRSKMLGTVDSFFKTLAVIVIFVINTYIIVYFWFYCKKKILQYFPANQKRPAGGALAGFLISIIVSILFVIFLVMLYPRQYKHFKFPLFSGLFIDIDLNRGFFSRIHGKLERMNVGWFNEKPAYSNDYQYSSGQPGGNTEFTNTYPVTPGINADSSNQKNLNTKGEELPIWARPPPDQEQWDKYPDDNTQPDPYHPNEQGFNANQHSSLDTTWADTVKVNYQGYVNRPPQASKTNETRAAPKIDPEQVPREQAEKLK